MTIATRRLAVAAVLGVVALVLPSAGVHAQACATDVHTLSSGDPASDDGAVQVTVDAAGWFGTAAFGAREALWNPPGAAEAASTTRESVVTVQGVPLRECVDVSAEVSSSSDRELVSTGRAGLVDFTLTQHLSPIAADGSAELIQTYAFTVRRLDASGIEVHRHADMGLPTSGAPDQGDERGVAARAGGLLGVVRAAQDVEDPGPLVGISGDLDGRHAPDRWAITDATTMPQPPPIEAEVANEVSDDIDGDRISDDATDAALTQTWTSSLNADDTVVFTTRTLFATAAPGEVATRPSAGRVAGADRIGTAVAVSRATFGPFGAQTVVIARADAYPDALAGAPLAARVAAPILLTGGDRLADEAATEISRLRAGRAIVLGGTDALSAQVDADLAAAGVREVVRIAGGDRFATAAAIAQEVVRPPDPEEPWRAGASPPFDGTVYVTEGANPDPDRGWPDALAVSALAGQQGRPILLVTSEALPTPTAGALDDLDVQAVTIVGGTAAVGEPVEEAITDRGIDVDRIAGADRYDTAWRVAEAALEDLPAPREVLVTSGAAYPDALVAGAAAASSRALLLLTAPDHAPDPTRQALVAAAPQAQVLTAIGGTAAITSAVLTALTATAGVGWATADHHGVWSAMPAAPIGGRSSAVAAWTGEEVIVWGGLGADDGAAYDPAARTWRPIAPAPFDGAHNHHAVWTGEEVLVWGSRDGSGDPTGAGAYDPAEDAWTVIPDPPLPDLRGAIAAWTGEELLVWGNVDDLSGDTAGAAYDPADQTWRRIADGPLWARTQYGWVFTGTELVIVGGRAGGVQVCAGECTPAPVLADGAAYDPAGDTWRALADAPHPIAGRAVWTGEEVVVLGGADVSGLALDPSADSWRLTAPAPAGVWAEHLAWTGSEALLWSHPDQWLEEDRGAAYDPASDMWTLLPPSGALSRGGAASVWAGDSWVIWGGFRYSEPIGAEEPSDGLIYTPTAQEPSPADVRRWVPAGW